jgi:hypothetical protein
VFLVECRLGLILIASSALEIFPVFTHHYHHSTYTIIRSLPLSFLFNNLLPLVLRNSESESDGRESEFKLAEVGCQAGKHSYLSSWFEDHRPPRFKVAPFWAPTRVPIWSLLATFGRKMAKRNPGEDQTGKTKRASFERY